MTQADLFGTPPPIKAPRSDGCRKLRFAGPEYSPKRDQARLGAQHVRIRDLMVDGAWRTLNQIAELTGDPPASISAQLRFLRRKDFGGYTVEKRHRGNGLFEYRILEGKP